MIGGSVAVWKGGLVGASLGVLPGILLVLIVSLIEALWRPFELALSLGMLGIVLAIAGLIVGARRGASWRQGEKPTQMGPEGGSHPPRRGESAPVPMLASLSPRELEVLQMLADGAGSGEITSALGISSEELRRDLDRILEALGVHSRLEAVGIEVTTPPTATARRDVWLCPDHKCCYGLIVRDIPGLHEDVAGEWHFTWDGGASRWRLRNPAGDITTERVIPEGVSPTLALVGVIPGVPISIIAEQIERLGFPPPGCRTSSSGVDSDAHAEILEAFPRPPRPAADRMRAFMKRRGALDILLLVIAGVAVLYGVRLLRRGSYGAAGALIAAGIASASGIARYEESGFLRRYESSRR